MVGEGFAAVFREREILVKTVSETPRAAMINWLMAYGDSLITNTTPDFYIRELFDSLATPKHVAIESVSLRIVKTVKP